MLALSHNFSWLPLLTERRLSCDCCPPTTLRPSVALLCDDVHIDVIWSCSNHLAVAIARCEVSSSTRHQVRETTTDLALLQHRVQRAEVEHQGAIRAYSRVRPPSTPVTLQASHSSATSLTYAIPHATALNSALHPRLRHRRVASSLLCLEQTLGVIRSGLLAFDFGFTLAPVFATAVEGARNGAGAEFTHLFLVDNASQVLSMRSAVCLFAP